MSDQLSSQASPPAGDAVDAEQDHVSSGRLFVTFMVGSEVFAVDMAPVQEIIRVPEMVRVPLAPPALDGLANLRGRVLPIISLARIFGFPERPSDDSSRAVVIDLGHPLGFVVDRVASVVEVQPEAIEDIGTINCTIDSAMLSGLLKNVAGHPMVMVLDFAYLISSQFSAVGALVNQASGSRYIEEVRTEEDDASSDQLQLVSFEVAGQEYAVSIDQVQEIVQVPEHLVQVPHAQPHVLGVMTLRQRLLPLVSLRSLFNLPMQGLDERSRIVVMNSGQLSVGVVMDSVKEVLRVHKHDVDPVPALLARGSDMADITQICRLDQGKRLVSVMEAGKLFDHSKVKDALRIDTSEQAAGAGEVLDDELDDEEQMVVFDLDAEEFGVPIASVQEIVRVPADLTRVPRTPAFVEGVINLRGAVLPVIDQRRRLGLARVARDDRQRIMVFLLGGMRTGFIVDAVTEVLKLPRQAIEPAPQLGHRQAQLITRVANLERQRRLILLIEPDRLLEHNDLSALEQLGEAV
ncbi:purine-binding chemotaxis protein CheW [Burkholderia glumae]|uniref:chemotaxis protein CheW n=1 Tax=Burkholderia glumae TaxID=337 RepID=UPI0021516DF1|nr:chemotaxis protein CheW [Burkholderia glumae]UVS87754.1 purine-binding chemotaxis protein CheW [Burkholderia glumae]